MMWMLPLYLHANQKSDYDDDDMYGFMKNSWFRHKIKSVTDKTGHF